MNRLWSAARFEMRTHLARKAFWITTFVLPIALAALALVVNGVAGQTDLGTTDGDDPGVDSRTAIGYVDEGGLLQAEPTWLPRELTRAFADAAEAQNALEQGDIDRYYLIPADYVEKGGLTVVQKHFRPLDAMMDDVLIGHVLTTGLSGDEQVARLLMGFTPSPRLFVVADSGDDPGAAKGAADGTAAGAVRVESADEETAAGASAGGISLPYILMFILYMALVMTGGYMLQSVSKEKENRTAEMLLITLSPRRLILGKIGGLLVVGLLQVTIWLAVMFAVTSTLGSTLGFDLQLSGQAATRLIAWTVAYFLLGYVMYSSAYATIGVLTPTARDAGHLSLAAIVPLMIPVVFYQALLGAPDGLFARVAGLFPLTSPVAMVARMGATTVPWWESALGLIILAVCAVLFALLAARFFRAENVLSASKLTWSRLRAELRRDPPGAASA